MTLAQKLKRWTFKAEFLEFYAMTLLVGHQGHTMKSAKEFLQQECERQMKLRGIKYPLKDTDE